MADLPSGTVTFLYTDLEGSTARWERQPAAMRAAVARHDAVLRSAIAAHHGHVFRTAGDGLCAAFVVAPDAVAAAVAAQLALNAVAWGEVGPLRARMALHTGAVEVVAGDYVGACLNRVGRLLALAYGGQVLLSLATEQLARDALPPDAGLRDLGEHRLRDLIQPERVFQLLHAELPTDFPPLRSLDAYPHNLPLQLTSFVGRERELGEVRRLLGTTRLLTLTGAGGCGKTRLALQVAAELVEAHPDGAWLVELAPLTDPDLVPAAVGAALGVREQAGQPLLTTLLAAVKSRRLLLVLDNCEHLLDTAARLADAVLRAGAGLRILATSREALGLAGEVAWRVPSLGLPPAPDSDGHGPAAVALLASEAARLFAERAGAARPGFAVTAENAAAVAEVCRRLDGIPLALELAAARLRALSAAELAARLDDRFRLLTGGSRTALPRQQTLRATVDWSHALLTEPERALLRRLSVFAGGCTLAAAEAVCGGPPDDGGAEAAAAAPPPTGAGDLPPGAVLDLLARLVEQSLVTAEEGPGGETRYRLPETVRQYAAERLTEAEEEAATRARHAGWVRALAAAAEPALWGGPEQVAAVRRLDAEHDNLRAALGWLAEADPPAGLALAADAWEYWRVRGHFREGWRWLDGGLRAAGDAAPARLRARVLLGAGSLARFIDLHLAQEQLGAGLALSRRLDDGRLLAFALRGLAIASLVLGQAERSRSLLAESVAAARAAGDRHGLGMALAMTAGHSASFPEASAVAAEGLQLLRAVGDRFLIANALVVEGWWSVHAGEPGRGEALEREALAVAEELGDRANAVIASLGLGWAAYWRGELDRAAGRYGQGLDQARRAQMSQMIIRGLDGLGLVAWRRGELERAAALLQEGLALATERGVALEAVSALIGLGLVAWGRGDAGAARARLRAGLARLPGDQSARHWHLLERLALARGLEASAWVTVADAPARAARRLGAAAALRAALGAPLPPVDRADHEAATAAARAALDEEAFAAALASGAARTLDEALAEALADEPAPMMTTTPTGATPRDPAGLTRREAEVLRLVARGATDAQIARALSISVKTVHKHVAGVLGKTGSPNRAAAAAFAVQHGLAEGPGW